MRTHLRSTPRRKLFTSNDSSSSMIFVIDQCNVLTFLLCTFYKYVYMILNFCLNQSREPSRKCWNKKINWNVALFLYQYLIMNGLGCCFVNMFLSFIPSRISFPSSLVTFAFTFLHPYLHFLSAILTYISFPRLHPYNLHLLSSILTCIYISFPSSLPAITFLILIFPFHLLKDIDYLCQMNSINVHD